MSSQMILWTSSKHIHWWTRLYLPLSIDPGSWEQWSGTYHQVNSCPHCSCQAVLIALLQIPSNSVNVLGTLGMNPARNGGRAEQMLRNSLSSFQDRKDLSPFQPRRAETGCCRKCCAGKVYPPVGLWLSVWDSSVKTLGKDQQTTQE